MAKNPYANYINPEEPHFVSFTPKEDATGESKKISHLYSNNECSICGSTIETENCIRTIKRD